MNIIISYRKGEIMIGKISIKVLDKNYTKVKEYLIKR